MVVELAVGGRGGRFPFSNCLLVKGVHGWVLVDAGCGRGVLERLGGRVDYVLFTHLHPDHFSGFTYVGGRFLVPAVDASYSSLLGLAARYAPGAVGVWLDYVWRVFRLDSVPPAWRVFDAWESIRVGGVEFEAVPARGHTWGHTLLLVGGHVHLSDVDLTGFGPWYGHPESSLEGFIADMRLARELVENASTVTTSHREKVFSPREALVELERYTSRLCGQLERVATAASDEPVRPGDLVGRGLIYRRYLPGMERIMAYFERVMVEKILYYLASQGAAALDGRGYRVYPERLERLCGRLRDTILS